MNDFDEFFMEGHADAVADTGGESFELGRQTVSCVWSEVSMNRTPDTVGFNDSREATVTFHIGQFTGDPRTIEGKRITRTKDNSEHRVNGVIDNGGGLYDLTLESPSQRE